MARETGRPRHETQHGKTYRPRRLRGELHVVDQGGACVLRRRCVIILPIHLSLVRLAMAHIKALTSSGTFCYWEYEKPPSNETILEEYYNVHEIGSHGMYTAIIRRRQII